MVTSDYTRQPTAVILDLDEDGQRGEMELVFPTRFQAEQFIYLLPYLMSVGDWTQVRGAILSPLIPSNSMGLETG